METDARDANPNIGAYVERPFTESPYTAKRRVSGTLVVVLRFKSEHRGLTLINSYSRCVQRGEVHELVATDEVAALGDTVQRAAFLGFVEFESGGVLLAGDRVSVNGRFLGWVCGFDLTHAPNHFNIVLRGSTFASGAEMGLELGDEVTFDFDEAVQRPSSYGSSDS